MTHWPFGDEWVESVESAKYLAVHYRSDKSWNTHFTHKIKAAELAVVRIRDAGLLEGRNVPNDSLEVIRAVVWSALDYGRAATLPRLTSHRPIQEKRENSN